MQRNSNPYLHFGRPLLGSLLATVAVAGLVLGLGGEKFRTNYATYVVIHVVYLTVIGFLIWLVFDVRAQRFKLPAVKKLIEDQLVLVCEPEEWLGYGAIVAIYRSDGDYERSVGTGLVINIQVNGLVQVKVVGGFDEDTQPEQLREELKGMQMSDIIIKPGQDWKR